MPELPSLDINRSLKQRLSDGAIYRPFLEKQDIELVLDFNAGALTLVPSSSHPGQVALTTADLGIPYVACYLDPITSTMTQVGWGDHWQLLESNSWIKWIWETAHSEELVKFGIPNVLTMPMAVINDDFDTSPLPDPDPGPAVAFMGHPASSWFQSQQPVLPGQLFAGLTTAAVHADMPDLPFHKIYHDLYQFAEPPDSTDDFATRVKRSADYFAHKFTYNAYLALKQRDRFARFLRLKLGDAFELIGDHWDVHYGLKHTPRIWDRKILHQRMRRVPICLNLMKGCLETGLNLRHFEVTAYGGFMLTYHTPELPAYFEIGKECDAFRDEEELLQKIHHYLNHPDERRAIAAAGQRRVLSQHLYSHRVTRLVELLQEAGVLPKTAVVHQTPTPVPKIHVEGVNSEFAPVGPISADP
ncbi:MAG: glycosyltransferase family 1 protein [Phycisphaerales bacterium]|nr:MAG: glycosyltransferase family 1 protein [Phycisphaerales bacterium]